MNRMVKPQWEVEAMTHNSEYYAAQLIKSAGGLTGAMSALRGAGQKVNWGKVLKGLGIAGAAGGGVAAGTGIKNWMDEANAGVGPEAPEPSYFAGLMDKLKASGVTPEMLKDIGIPVGAGLAGYGITSALKPRGSGQTAPLLAALVSMLAGHYRGNIGRGISAAMGPGQEAPEAPEAA